MVGNCRRYLFILSRCAATALWAARLRWPDIRPRHRLAFVHGNAEVCLPSIVFRKRGKVAGNSATVQEIFCYGCKESGPMRTSDRFFMPAVYFTGERQTIVTGPEFRIRNAFSLEFKALFDSFSLEKKNQRWYSNSKSYRLTRSPSLMPMASRRSNRPLSRSILSNQLRLS